MSHRPESVKGYYFYLGPELFHKLLIFTTLHYREISAVQMYGLVRLKRQSGVDKVANDARSAMPSATAGVVSSGMIGGLVPDSFKGALNLRGAPFPLAAWRGNASRL